MEYNLGQIIGIIETKFSNGGKDVLAYSQRTSAYLHLPGKPSEYRPLEERNQYNSSDLRVSICVKLKFALVFVST
jgi:hypothetical protein